MKAWYSKVRDIELIDGSVRADYVVTFETDNFELKQEVEKYLQGVIDEDEQTELKETFTTTTSPCVVKAEQTENSSEIPNNCENCRFELYCPEMCEGCCEWDSHFEPKDEPQIDCLTCRYNSDEWDSPKCDGCSKAYSNYEPQMDCGWK